MRRYDTPRAPAIDHWCNSSLMAENIGKINVTLKRVAIEDFDDFVFSSVAGGNNPDTKGHLEALSNS